MTNYIIFDKETITLQDAIKALNSALDGHETRESIYNLAIQALEEKQERDNPQPLTLDELRQMDGQPVFVADKLNSWGIVIVDNSGIWSGIPFVQGRYFNYNADTREINCYRYPPKEEKCTQA